MKRIILLVAILVIALSFDSFSQPKESIKISEQQEISIFASYYTFDLPASVVNNLDDSIVNLFLNMKRFKVKGYQFRFSEGNLEKFLARLKELQETKITTSEKFVDPKWGTITLTPEILEKLINSFTIIIPNIKSFGVETRYDAGQPYYEVTIRVSLKFFDPGEGEVFHTIDITKTVSGKSSELIELITGIKGRNLSREETINLAVDNIIDEIKYQIRGIEKFKLYTTIVDISNGKYYIELGKNYDINPGLELDVIKTKKIKIGGKERTVTENVGLARVVKVEEDFSEVIPIFGSLQINDQLVDCLRRGFIFKVFLGIQQMVYNTPTDTSLLTYFKDKWNNLQNYNPLVIGISGINDDSAAYFEPQVDITLVLSSPLTITLDLIGNYSIYLGNLKIKPYIGLNLLGSFAYLGGIYWWWYYLEFYLTTFSIGGTAGINIEYLISKYLGFSLGIGYKHTIPVYNLIRAYDNWGIEYTTLPFTSDVIPDFGFRGLGGNVSFLVRF
ncbi:MAG: hypothetical protein ACK4F9_00125 [Brevinematia bacterium]